jgi:hypothetical protein
MKDDRQRVYKLLEADEQGSRLQDLADLSCRLY